MTKLNLKENYHTKHSSQLRIHKWNKGQAGASHLANTEGVYTW